MNVSEVARARMFDLMRGIRSNHESYRYSTNAILPRLTNSLLSRESRILQHIYNNSNDDGRPRNTTYSDKNGEGFGSKDTQRLKRRMSWQRRLHHQQQEQQQHHTQRPQRRRLHAAQPGRIGMPQSHPARFSPSSTAMVSRVAFLNIVIRLPILGFLLNHCAAWFFVQAVVTATPTTTTGTIPTTTATASTTGVSDSTRDVLVQAAPFCAAVVCRDGVALLATHTMDSEEPLLYFDHRDENDIGTTSVLNHQLYQDRPIPPTTTDPAMAEAFTIAQNDTTILVASHNILSGLWDLPESYAGPFRIHTIDAYGTSLLTVGWRADGDNLRQRARKLAITYQRQYGDANIPANRSYRNYLAQELALYLAECALSDSVRLPCALARCFC